MPDSLLTQAIREIALSQGDCQVLAVRDVARLASQFHVPVREVEICALEANVLPARYQRNLGTVGWEGQLRLLRSTCGIVGLGGLGGWVIEGLARMGVGRLVIVDGDRFSDNNLNRQALCVEATLGMSKVQAAVDRIRAINPAVDPVPFDGWADQTVFLSVLSGAQVVVDALDTIPTRLALQDAAQALGIPMVHGAIAGYIGQVMTVFPGDPGLHALYPTEDVPERGIERQWGNPAGTPMMIAAWQIQEVVKIITGRGEPLRQRMLFLDAEHGSAEFLRVE